MTPEEEKAQRIVAARMRLRERFFEKMNRTPGASDDRPQGSGPPNRHGMPRLPVGQREVTSWPVLDLGAQPTIALSRWRLEIDGAVEEPASLTWEDFQKLPQTENVSDFHCVTTWSLMDQRWKGVQFATIAALLRPLAAATHVMIYAYDGYTTNLPLEE